MKLTRRTVTFAGIGALVIGGVAWSFRPAAVPVDVAVVSAGDLMVTVDDEGETRVRERFVISAPASGRILRIELEPGDTIKAGEDLAVLKPGDPTPLDLRARATAQARVEAAEAALGLARADRDRVAAELAHAQAQHRRTERLAAEKVVSQESLETSQLSLKINEEALAAADYAVRTAGSELAAARAALLEATGERVAGGRPITIRSPVDGVVLRRLRESESVVPVGEPLLEVGDPACLEIVTDLLSTEAVKVEAGDRVLIEHWGGPTPLQGRVRRVEPSGFTKISALGVEEQRVNTLIDLDDPRDVWEALGDGFRVEVRIVVEEHEDVLKLPTSSLFRHGEHWAVFAVEEQRAALREITLGARNGLAAEVVDGITAGETVIVHPSDKVADGVRIKKR